MKSTLTKNLRRAFRAVELAVAVALLAVLLELVLIQLNHPRGYPDIALTGNPVPTGTQPASRTTNAEHAAPLQMAAQPAAPKAAPAPNVLVRPAPAQSPQPIASFTPAPPPPLLSFHYLRQHVWNFAQFNFFPASPASSDTNALPGNPPPRRSQQPVSQSGINLSTVSHSTTNVPVDATNHVQIPNSADATMEQPGASQTGTRTNRPAGVTDARPGIPAVAQLRAPDLRNTNGMFRLAIP